MVSALQKMRYRPMQETHRHDEKETQPQVQPKKGTGKNVTDRAHAPSNHHSTEQNNTEYLASKSLD